MARRFTLAVAASTVLVFAAGDARRSFNIAAGELEPALRRFAEQAGIHLIFSPDLSDGLRTNGVKGDLDVAAAARRLLEGTNLTLVPDSDSSVYSLARVTPPNSSTPGTSRPPASDQSNGSSKKKETQTGPNHELMKRKNLLNRLAMMLAMLVGSPGNAQTVSAETGTIEGRVLNATSGNYLNNARVTVEGTHLETFTNDFGEYRLVNVPAGAVTVRAAFTGLGAQTGSVTVAAGQRATRDFNLTRAGLEAAAPGETVVMDAFITAATKEMSGREIAINEQRFAPNLKNVVSADEFGDMAEGNVGEFLKYLPGITIDNVGPDARNISVRGLPPAATPVMIDGAPVASAVSATASRVFELEQVSINNVSRIEVTKSPTPDLPANAVGGAVNMISRSAFERAKPLFSYRAYLNWDDDEDFLQRTRVGPSRESSVHTNPSFDFSYLRPVNENFGFTLTGLYSDAYNADYRSPTSWVPTGAGSALATADNPFLRNYRMFYGPKATRRMSVGTTLDWRVSRGNVLTFGAQWNNYDAFFNNKTADMNTLGSIGNQPPAAWGPTFTQSRPGAATVNRGSSLLRKYGTTVHFSLKYLHDGPVWKIDAGATRSDSTNHHRNPEEGFVYSSAMSLLNLTLRLDQIDPTLGVPRAVTATNAAGEPVDWTHIAPYRINNIVFNEQDSRDQISSARVNAQREFSLPLFKAPVAVKIGLDVRRMDRDIRDHNRTRYNFVGPDRSNAASSTDDYAGLYDLVDYGFYRDGKSGYGEPWLEYPSPYKMHDLFTAHPEYFAEDLPFRIQNEATDSKKLIETVSAAYLRTDWRFFGNRLWVVAGARYERTGDEGFGVRNDPTALYQKDAKGDLIRGANGLPIRIAGLDAASAARLQYVDRGASATRDYDGIFPSANVVLNLRPNLLLRASYAKTITRPELSAIIPGMTITDPNTSNTNNLLITVNNTGLNPWTAENVDLGLEYYFGQAGGNVISIGGFRKDIKDFFASRRVDATPELLESFGLDDSYLTYDVSYRFNAGDARVTGLEFNYRQGLTFLPHWARGVDIFYNFTSQHLQGTTLADFDNFIRRNDNYGFTVSRPKFTVRFKVNDRGRQRLFLISGTNVIPGTYRYKAPRRAIDIDFEYRLRRGVSLFVAGRNVTNAPSRHDEAYGNGTPEYARSVVNWIHGVTYMIGVKGSF